MNFSGHEMSDSAGLSSTESEPLAALGSAEKGETERQHLHKTSAGVGTRE